MKNTCATWLVGSVVLCVLGTATGCGTPSLFSVATAETAIREDGLVGHWVSEESHAIVGQPMEDAVALFYPIALFAMAQDEIKGSRNVIALATKIGENRYLDLSLSENEQIRLFEQYGGLVVPAHQIMRYTLEGDSLTLWSVNGRKLANAGGLAKVNFPIEQQVLSADTAALRKMLESAPDNAFDNKTEFKRVR